MNYTDLILAIYTLLFIFSVYMAYKIVRAKAQIKGNRESFYQRTKFLLYILMTLLILMVYIAQGLYLKVILVGILIYVTYTIIEKITFFDQGIYFNGRIVRYEEIRSWHFNDKTGDLIVRLAAAKETRIFPVRKPDMDRINRIIKDRKAKNKKK